MFAGDEMGWLSWLESLAYLHIETIKILELLVPLSGLCGSLFV